MRPPIKSPIQAKVGSPLFLVKLAADLLRVHKDFLSKIDEFLRESKEVKVEAARIKNLPKGDKGDRGIPGYTPVKGKDYFDGEKGEPGKDGEMPDIALIADLVQKSIRLPKDGLDAQVNYELILEELKKLQIKDFPAIEREMASYRNQLAGKHYGKDTWVRGGGDTVAAGTNITITSDADGNRVINAAGGSGIAIETPAGTVNAVNTVFTPSKEPLYVIADGITSFDGVGYTWDGTNITMDIAPSIYIRDAITP